MKMTNVFFPQNITKVVNKDARTMISYIICGTLNTIKKQFTIKAIAQPKKNEIMSSFNYSHIVPNLFDFYLFSLFI